MFQEGGTVTVQPASGWGPLWDATSSQWIYFMRWRPNDHDAVVYLDLAGLTVSSQQPLPDALVRILELAPATTSLTATAAGSATTLHVRDAHDFVIYDTVRVMLDNGAIHTTTLSAVPTQARITIASALPSRITPRALLTAHVTS